jgi:uncharacterized protein YjbJ (UPF0337 family)
MTPPDDPQRTIGGLAGKAVGNAQEALGRAADSDGQETKKRRQEAESEAEVRAERDRLATRVAAEQRAAQPPPAS